MLKVVCRGIDSGCAAYLLGPRCLFFFLSRRLSCRIDHMHQCNVFLAAGNSVTVLQVCVHCYKAAKVSSLTLSVCELV